jgi:hypothetical protein
MFGLFFTFWCGPGILESLFIFTLSIIDDNLFFYFPKKKKKFIFF